MIHTMLHGAWGTDEIPDGVQLNVKPEKGVEIVYSMPFTGEAHLQLAKEVIEKLPPEKKRELIPLLTNGIEVPKNFEIGPQG